MCRIVINPDQLAETAALLRNAAGEYQAIGANVGGCNCGCMPADVAAVVDAATAAIRSSLHGVAGELAAQGGDASTRAGVDQSGVTTGAISAAWGGGAENSSTMTIGGFGGSLFGSSTGGSTLAIGGTNLDFGSSSGGSSLIIGGNDFGLGNSGGGGSLIIGGNDFGLGNSGGGGSLIIGGNDFGLGNSGDGGGGLVIGGTDLPFPNTDGGLTLTIYPEPLPEITLGPTGDPFLDDTAAWLASHRAASLNLAASGFRFNGPTIFDVTTAQANSTLNWTVSGGEYRYNYGEHSNFFYRPGELYGTRS